MKDQSRIIRIPLGRVNAYFVVGEGQVLLIDTGCRTFYPGHGSPFEVEKFRRSLEREKKRSGRAS